MEEALEFFRDNGFYVQRGALSPAEVAAAREGMAVVARAHPDEWQLSEARRAGIGAPSIGADSPHMCERTTALDALAYHPSVVPFVRRVIGQQATLSSFTYVHRLPCDAAVPADLNEGDPRCLTRQWHREYSGAIAGAELNEYFAPALQVIYYLDDVDPENHCFSVIPESAATKRILPTKEGSLGLHINDAEVYLHPEKPTWVDAYGREMARRTGGIDCYASAGAAVILNNASFHCVTERNTARQRRTVHARYRLPELPVSSSHGIKPPFETVAEYTAALPDRPALRPPPLDSSMRGGGGKAKL